MSWIQDVLDWDESQDPAQAPVKTVTAPWHALGTWDRQLLDALADGAWTKENTLRETLKWGWVRFLLTTTRMVLVGWIEARQESSFFTSEYRLSEEAWK